tara:strand:+ start:6243 stop:6677 length:435 start_codon:yes stop_codon:yes gene_type:complete
MSEQDSKYAGSSFWSSGGLVKSQESEEKSQGSPSEKAKALTIAGNLERALSFLRSTARTNDYFTGYSLNEIIQERIELIGEDNDETEATIGSSTKLTLISTLNSILVDLVGEGPKHDGGSIQEALNLEIQEPVIEEEEYETKDD